MKKIILKKEAIANLTNRDMNIHRGGNMSNRTLPHQGGCDSNGANCCTYNQCGNIPPTHQLCNTYKAQTCDQASMYGATCTECTSRQCTADGGSV